MNTDLVLNSLVDMVVADNKRKPICIILNGPPGVGKDTLANHLCERISSFNRMEFKEPLIKLALQLSGVSRKLWDAHYTQEFKNTPWDRLLERGVPVSPRRYLQFISEDVMKPTFGKDIFGIAALKTIKDHNLRHVVFSDGGFDEEIAVLDNHYQRDECIVIRLHRSGFDFSNDTRKHVYDCNYAIDINVRDWDIPRTLNDILLGVADWRCVVSSDSDLPVSGENKRLIREAYQMLVDSTPPLDL